MTTASVEDQTDRLLNLTKDVSPLNSSQVAQLVTQLENLLSGPNISLALGRRLVTIISNLLNASADTLASSSTRIIRAVETLGLKLEVQGETEIITATSLALAVKKVDGANFKETSFSIADHSNLQRGSHSSARATEPGSTLGSITLPASLTDGLTPEEQLQASRVQFNFYQKSTVFQDRALGQRRLNSDVLGTSVANLSISGLRENVVFTLQNKNDPEDFTVSCVFWDFSLNDGSGGWNPDGCSVQNTTEEETVCSCNHLTNFAVLLDISREGITDHLHDTILTFITHIGCGISAIFLSVTLLTHLTFENLRRDIPSKILIQLCMALLLLNLVFLLDSWLALYPSAVGLCISTAFFLHYFLLVSFTWMGLEAFHMYLTIVKIFNAYLSKHMLKFSLFGWGVPLIVVITAIAISKDNYGLISYGSTDDFCWLKNDIAFYVAVVAYFCLIFVVNLAMFVMVMVQLYQIKQQNPHNFQHRSRLQDLRSAAGLTVLLGLTWGFAFFAWGPVKLAFMYLFAIFNSLQGFFIFTFHCLIRKEVRKTWRTYLCCGKLQLEERSYVAVQNPMQKNSVIAAASFHSASSTLSSSTSSTHSPGSNAAAKPDR
ncbi:adhesion G-protein coupled receptor G2-like [Megalops cyprinoides]|uniref:adhesion G-protein coupled receptor G2-like n=1 Tax=Megalops cyprinoides TaxID=118141 RepID=UPI001865202F|nr:adhesion G-protein coupled receptor G2-like [Megalops cyprinoides]